MNGHPGEDGASTLRQALHALGVHADVEGRERLAVLVPTSPSDMALLADDATRRQAIALARSAGFTNIALEIRPAARASLSRD